MAGGGEVRLVALTKRFADTVAVDGIDLTILPGEFFSLLGPSGCGKTTTLRMIAGFERPTSGQILLDDVDVGQVPPNKRGVNTVFQNYALFPHLNVHDNVAFGLRFRSMKKDERHDKVQRALSLVHLAGFDRRRSSQLSGGQQQRVALARALILEPSVLLLDEPLGALDAKLRKALQVELKALQEEVGITFIYVTHDQEEALTMSDRLAVMNAGRIEQIGPPRAVYEEPLTAYVADFLGVSNLMDASVEGRANGAVKVTIRPERVQVEPYGTDVSAGANRIPGMIERLVFLGSSTQVIVRLAPGAAVQALIQNDGEEPPYRQGTPVSVVLPAEALRVLRTA
jgi:spermidine/putrescine transport system ATP-binding protein